jgi:hypothetical protein
MNKVAKIEDAGSVLEQVVIVGDLAKLTSEERVDYYKKVCTSVGLNFLTRPFDYITLNGKLTLYAKRDAADQLRKMHGVSVKIISKEEVDGLLMVHVAAQDRTGRTDEDYGAVTIAGLRGEARANAMAKAVTKAKRRVTLSICGLGWLTDAEIDSIPSAEAPKHNLDQLFPGTEAPSSPQIAEDGVHIPVVPDQSENAPAASEATPTGITLYLGDETYQMDTAKEFYEEYLKQLKHKAEVEEVPSRERMTELKDFEADNKIGLNIIPPIGKKKLTDWRKKLNRKLGAQSKKERSDE